LVRFPPLLWAHSQSVIHSRPLLTVAGPAFTVILLLPVRAPEPRSLLVVLPLVSGSLEFVDLAAHCVQVAVRDHAAVSIPDHDPVAVSSTHLSWVPPCSYPLDSDPRSDAQPLCYLLLKQGRVGFAPLSFGLLRWPDRCATGVQPVPLLVSAAVPHPDSWDASVFWPLEGHYLPWPPCPCLVPHFLLSLAHPKCLNVRAYQGDPEVVPWCRLGR
jgi:hypothetical protein